jgi:cellulose synthase/poly-beta-1,6-N-acetylglucosamine synthase-like glycosyltransferase
MPLGWLRERLRNGPALAARMKLVDPQRLRRAVLERARRQLSKIAADDLFTRFPDYSAKTVANAWQGSMLGILLTMLPVGLALAWRQTLLALHLLATLFFLSCIALRFAAASAPLPRRQDPPSPVFEEDMPVYSVLVALYKEAKVVPGLLAGLERLVWPRDRIEIKLVCEADDSETIAAIRAADPPSWIELVEVPPSLPRTKPKALCYALPMAGGELVALFDAEDAPHPLQLVEAWRRFRQAGPDLATVQAPLGICNREAGIIPRLFAFEYAALFRGLLPWLSRRGYVLPLGGTSNHFRRAALQAVGAWDPYNVTEDADLGLRLARFGYRTETISLPTLETAPRDFRIWLPQRTRWLKGWAQTWLVHMREPLRLFGELGFGSFLVAQILLAGMVASSLVHPLLVGTALTLAAMVAFGSHLSFWGSVLLLVDVLNLFCGYFSFLLLGWQTLERGERSGFWKVVAFTPVYWMMISLAGWRAVWQLWRRPHHWEKTPHDEGAAPGHRSPG